ncbi:MAG: hypothetical protein A3G35_19270 [candidate division NC10 bacterium RIFCSPLOWO2_12_FULL_66_18]|nr:MAG: hypothetical protein A3H39_07305 [candidate division NC10 bacterium RIFCSPLOWO2_02_FULL_66_22]OGB99870.1 MAG: hypothetical protein A3G35_19270 [candidate division NC10 bacterium RIFCSPLOWO2_12_FULL_66_18]
MNKSGTVAGEIGPLLADAGLTLIDTYLQSLPEVPHPPMPAWEMPSIPASLVEQAATVQPLQPGGGVREFVAVLGVSAASANGRFYFVQHMDNITRMVAEAQIIVVVVPLEKITGDQTEAEDLCRAQARHGIQGLYRDFSRRDRGGLALEDLPLLDRPGGLGLSLNVILLDNGRSALARQPAGDLLRCIGCRACAVACPTQRYFGGPANLNPREYILGALQGRVEDVSLCVLCGLCKDACPVDIDMPRFLAERKAREAETRGVTLSSWLLGNARTVSRLSSAVAPLANAMLANPLARTLMEKTTGITRNHRLTRYASESFEAWWARHTPRTGGRKVAYFTGCYATYSAPEIARAFVEVMERNGFEVVRPPQRCSGLPLIANGQEAAARGDAQFNLAQLGALVREGCEIVTTCTSCSYTLRKEYPRLLGDAASELTARVHDATSFIMALYARNELKPPLGRIEAAVAYHLSCHGRASGLGDTSVRLMNLIPGIQAAAVNRGCCGQAGTFGLKCGNYGMAMQIGSPLLEAIRRPEIDIPSTDCPTCKMQMEHGSGRPVMHPVILLRDSYVAARPAETEPHGTHRDA